MTYNLIILGDIGFNQIAGNRIRALTKYLPENVKIFFFLFGKAPEKTFYHLNGEVVFFDIPVSRIPIIKRFKLQHQFAQQILEYRDFNPKKTIFLYSSPPTYLAPTLKILGKKYKTILDIRDIYQEWTHHPRLKRKLETYEQIKTMKAVDCITYSHPGFEPFLKRDKAKKLKFLTNGADSEIFYLNGPKRVLSNPEKIIVVYAGGIDKYHEAEIWVEIFNQLDNNKFHLIFVGYGNGLKTIKKRANAKNISFFGKTTQLILAEFIRSADYTVASGSNKHLDHYKVGIPTKIFESLLCGTPVIASNGASVEQMAKNNPFITNFQDKNVDQMIKHFKTLEKTTEEDRIKITQSAQIFDFKNTAIKFNEILNLILLQ